GEAWRSISETAGSRAIDRTEHRCHRGDLRVHPLHWTVVADGYGVSCACRSLALESNRDLASSPAVACILRHSCHRGKIAIFYRSRTDSPLVRRSGRPSAHRPPTRAATPYSHA